jgi:TP901 family phage tail tape measure protein
VSVVANVAINVDSRNAVSKLRQVQTQAQATEKAFGALQSAIGALGVGFALTKVIADVKELDTSLRRLGTVGGNVAALDKGLGVLSDRLDGVANKAELAAASYQALSAGFTETGANLRVVEAATKAAVGGLVDVTSVVEVTTKTLNAYNMSGDQATKVTDSISKAIEFGQVQWSDYTSQLGRVASIAAIAGVSLDEVNAFIAAATKNGATAEVAFTGLGATLAMMLKPSKESAEAAEALGINWTLAGIRGEGFESLMGKLAIAMQQNPVLATEMVGGQEALRGAFAAAAKGGKDYAMILEGLGGAAGKTDADFQTMKGSLENTFKALDTSFKNLSEALGKAFGPTIVIAIQDITKGVNAFADFMAEVPQPVMDTVGTIVKLIAQILLVQKAIQSVIALKAGVNGMLAATAASATAAGTAAGGAATKVNMLKGAMLGLLRFGLVTLAIEIVVSGLGKLAEVQARMNAITKGSTKQFAEQVGGSAASQQEIENLKKQNREERARRVQEQKDVRFPLLTAQDDIARQAITQLDTRFAQLQTMGERARFATPADRARADATPAANAMGTPLGSTVGGGGGRAAGGASKAASDAKRAADEALRESQRVADVIKDQQFITKQKGIQTKFAQLIFEAEQDADPIRVRQLQTVEALVLAGNETARLLEEEKNSVAQLAIARTRQGEAEAIRQQGLQDVLKLQLEQKKNFDAIIADLELELKLKQATTEQERERLRIAAERAKLEAQLKGLPQSQIDQATGLQAQIAAPDTAAQTIKKRIGTLKDEIAALTNIGNIAITVADGIGAAFGQAFQGLISGSMSAQEALGSFFKSVGDMFVSMAAEIIAKQMTMIILQTILKALGAVGGGGGGFAPLDNAGATNFSFNPGSMLEGPGFMPRAGGGPTAAGTPYLVGERGPELFVPGSNGGVMSNNDLRSAMNSQGGGGAASPVLNMSFESTTIGGVEYVSREQLEQAMAETRRAASRDGAQRGMTMTLDRIQNSSSTRRRIGV